MSRDNYNQGTGEMGNNHSQNLMISDAARSVGIPVQELSDEVHARKNRWYSGDFSYSQLVEIAKELKKNK